MVIVFATRTSDLTRTEAVWFYSHRFLYYNTSGVGTWNNILAVIPHLPRIYLATMFSATTAYSNRYFQSLVRFLMVFLVMRVFIIAHSLPIKKPTNIPTNIIGIERALRIQIAKISNAIPKPIIIIEIVIIFFPCRRVRRTWPTLLAPKHCGAVRIERISSVRNTSMLFNRCLYH